jgi:hypothetical protein
MSNYTNNRIIKNNFPLLKGSCIWFAKNNWSDNGERPIRKCRNGSLCRYLHLTGEECQYIFDHQKDTVECEHCIFKYEEKKEEKTERKIYTNIPEGNRPKIFDDLENEDLWDKIRKEMPCWQCKDTRKMPARRRYHKKAQLRNWCDCSKDLRLKAGSTHYSGNSHPSGEKDAWVCNNCKCISQVG